MSGIILLRAIGSAYTSRCLSQTSHALLRLSSLASSSATGQKNFSDERNFSAQVPWVTHPSTKDEATKDLPDPSRPSGPEPAPFIPLSYTDYTTPRSEEGRALEWRTVYDFPEWIVHRSSTRLFQSVACLFRRSTVTPNTLPPLIWVTSISTALVGYMYLFQAGLLPPLIPGLLMPWPDLAPNPAAHTFVSMTTVALSLLLVFRTNTSYARWDEARKMLGLMVNRSRDLSRQANALFPDKVLKDAFTRWLIVYTRTVRLHLQPDKGLNLDIELSDILKPDELSLIKAESHKPLFAMHVMGEILASAKLSEIQHAKMADNLTAYQDIIGGSERILRAPIPISYTRHTSRFLLCWLTCLPFSIFPVCGAYSIIVCFGVSAIFVGIEEIGVQVEEPYGILPFKAINKRIEMDVLATLKSDDAVKAYTRSISQSTQANDIASLIRGKPI